MDSRLNFLLLFATAFSFSTCLAQSNLISGRKGLRDQLVDRPLSYSNQSVRIDPSRVVQVSWRPRVFLYKGFLSDDECDHLISLASNSKDNPSRNSAGSGNTVSTELLNGSGVILNTTDDIIARIENRIAVWTLLPKDHGMPFQIMQYRGEEAKHKYFYGNRSAMSSSSEPLMATVVLYLSDSASGGEMLFPESKVKSKFWSGRRKKKNFLRPVKGNAILFFSVHLNASPDKSSYHIRYPIRNGELWVATKFLYLRPPTGNKHTIDSNIDGCIDEDKSCPQWAAIGECERNAVFMVGSPDYYGTCRKSCNAC
ncbi:putative prolyl 4-hydroxylase 12 [Cucumis melo var. makuwa]|uniref:procollagen-proline 4-dioxygenase n=1 Tax=Cucumis melo var. makuwa TaxID=1194695 RepID=A0A5A7TKX1_CUCMM|nr:putative prolyl 4-hydroxylase 12 [Cucumis melo var. makuwa]